MDISKSKVLVTGAAGFIGSHLVEHLLTQGSEVTALVRYNSLSSIGWLSQLSVDQRKRLKIIQGDVRDPWSMLESSRGADAIFHLAALISIPYSYHAPDAYVETNIRGTTNILRAAQIHGTRKVVITSTSEVYGTAVKVPMSEDHPLQGQSPYSATKIGADQIALSFYRSFDLPVTVLRPFNCYGPRQSTRAIIPTIISQILSDSESIRVGSLEPTRDFTYVDDTVRAFISAAKTDESNGRVINAGSGSEISIGNLVEKIQNYMGSKKAVTVEKARLRPEKSEVLRLLSDNSEASKRIGWKAEIGFEEGLKRTIRWFSDPKNLAYYPSNEYRV